jgi:hypothetical protein
MAASCALRSTRESKKRYSRYINGNVCRFFPAPLPLLLLLPDKSCYMRRTMVLSAGKKLETKTCTERSECTLFLQLHCAQCAADISEHRPHRVEAFTEAEVDDAWLLLESSALVEISPTTSDLRNTECSRSLLVRS